MMQKTKRRLMSIGSIMTGFLISWLGGTQKARAEEQAVPGQIPEAKVNRQQVVLPRRNANFRTGTPEKPGSPAVTKEFVIVRPGGNGLLESVPDEVFFQDPNDQRLFSEWAAERNLGVLTADDVTLFRLERALERLQTIEERLNAIEEKLGSR